MTNSVNWIEACTRHTMGSNLGFADGHVKFMAAQAIQAGRPALVTP